MDKLNTGDYTIHYKEIKFLLSTLDINDKINNILSNNFGNDLELDFDLLLIEIDNTNSIENIVNLIKKLIEKSNITYLFENDFFLKLNLDINNGSNIEDIKHKIVHSIHLIIFSLGINNLGNEMHTITRNEQEKIEQKSIGKSESIIINTPSQQLSNISILLREKIGIDTLKVKLEQLRIEGDKDKLDQFEIFTVNKILKCIHEYPYQLLKENNGYKINKILGEKEIFCVGYSLLGHVFMQELNINHYGMDELRHSSLLVTLSSNKNYYFDGFKNSELKEIKWGEQIGSYKKFYIEGNEEGISILGCPQEILLSYIFTNKGIDLDENGDYSDAIICFKKAINCNKNNAYAYDNLGISYHNLGEYEDAISSYDIAIKIYPNFSHSYNNKGVTLLEKGLFQEAIICFKKALSSVNIKNDSIYYKSSIICKLGLTYLKLGDKDSALRLYNDVVINSPTYLKVYQLKSDLYRKENNILASDIYDFVYRYLNNTDIISVNIPLDIKHKLIILLKHKKYLDIDSLY